jgi:glycosyltransferase involved in cell wall biosynthesis
MNTVQPIGPIGIVTPRYPPAIGGIEHHVEHLAKEMAVRGVAVEIITTDPTGLLPTFEQQDRIAIWRFPTIKNDSVFFLSPRLVQWLYVNAQRFSLLHAHSYHTPLAFATALVSQQYRIPFVVTPHYHGTGHSRFRRALHIPYSIFGRWMLRKAQRIICVSASERHLLQSNFRTPLPAVVIPNAINLKALNKAIPFLVTHERKRILSVGRLERYKQIDSLVAALPLLPAHYDLILIGDGPMRAELEQLAENLGVQNRLHWAGRVSETDLMAWYKTADVFVSLSQHEAFGMVVLEALAGGTPVVASAIPSHVEIAQYAPPEMLSFVKLDGTASALAAAIMAATQQGRRDTINHRTFPTWSKVADMTLAQYDSIYAHSYYI